MQGIRWEEADLVRRLCRALDVAKNALELFAVDGDGYADAEVPENSFRPDKPIAETTMLIYAASVARRFPDVACRIDEIARLLVPLARSQRVFLNIGLHPSLAMDFAVPHVLLTKLGYHDATFDNILKFCLSSQAAHGHERPPFASLEQRWIRSLWTDIEPGQDWLPDLHNSVVYHPHDILGGLRQDAYAFTHLIMYCTDFGFRVPNFPRSRAAIMAQARAQFAKCLDDEDYDLAAELLLAWPLSGARWCASATFGFRVLAHIDDEVGVLPSGTTRPDRLNKLAGKERTEYAIGTAYHTALVMGLLCAASLRPGRAPYTKITGSQVEKRFLDRLLLELDRDQGHWQPEFEKLSESERNAVAPLLLDIAVCQKFRKHDYESASKLLREASKYGMSDSPICGQAAQLLERLVACSYAFHVNDSQLARIS